MSDHTNTNDVTPAEIAALDHRPVCGYCGKPLGEAACKSSLPDSPMFHSASCMMKWEVERGQKPTKITAGKLVAQWERVWKPLVDAGKCNIWCLDRIITAIKPSAQIGWWVLVTDSGLIHVGASESLIVDWKVFGAGDTPPAETQGDNDGKCSMCHDLGELDAILMNGSREYVACPACLKKRLEAMNATLTRELAAARIENGKLRDGIAKAMKLNYMGSACATGKNVILQKTLDDLRKAAGEVSNGE